MSNANDATEHNYRCVCPPPLPKVYLGNACFGPPGSGCATLNDENKRHNLDVSDRPPLPKNGAVWECSLYGGRLASALQLTEGIQQGMAGSDIWLHSADEVHHQRGAVVRWTDGDGFQYRYTGNGNALSWSDAIVTSVAEVPNTALP